MFCCKNIVPQDDKFNIYFPRRGLFSYDTRNSVEEKVEGKITQEEVEQFIEVILIEIDHFRSYVKIGICYLLQLLFLLLIFLYDHVFLHSDVDIHFFKYIIYFCVVGACATMFVGYIHLLRKQIRFQ